MLKHTEFKINPFESDFLSSNPSPLWDFLSLWPPLGISNSLCGGGMDIFRSTQYRFLRSESQNGLIFNLKVANINFPWVLKWSCVEKFGQFPSAEQLFFFH